MNDLLRSIYQQYANLPSTLGILLIEKTKPNSPITDNFDNILLIITANEKQTWDVRHYECKGKVAAVHVVNLELLIKWIDTSGYHSAVEWLIHGKVLYDRNECIADLKEQLRNFPHKKRNLRKAIEFGKLVKSYNEAKALYDSEQFMDAHSKMILSLHYLGRLAIIEKGYVPEVTVWHQVKQIDPEVYKLHEELIQSDEDMEKRIHLMIIAADFVISTRAHVSAKHLLDIMKTDIEPWSYGKLKCHPMIAPYALDLSAIIDYLTEKEIVKAKRANSGGSSIYERKYVAGA